MNNKYEETDELPSCMKCLTKLRHLAVERVYENEDLAEYIDPLIESISPYNQWRADPKEFGEDDIEHYIMIITTPVKDIISELRIWVIINLSASFNDRIPIR